MFVPDDAGEQENREGVARRTGNARRAASGKRRGVSPAANKTNESGRKLTEPANGRNNAEFEGESGRGPGLRGSSANAR